MRWFIVVFIMVAVAGAAYWFGFREILDDGVRVVDSHEAQLDAILSIAQRNSDLVGRTHCKSARRADWKVCDGQFALPFPQD